MCKSIAEGGQRCRSHLRKADERLTKNVNYWQEQVFARESKLKQHRTRDNERNLNTAKRNLEKYTQELGQVAVELAEANLRLDTAKENKTKRGVLDDFVSLDLSPTEWGILSEEAKVYTFGNRSRLIRERLTRLPTIKARKGIANLEWNGARALGHRYPTEGAKGNYHREGRGVRIDATTRERLRAEAEVFNLTVSDYARCLLLDIDPRTLGHHIGQKKQERIAEIVGYQEEAHNLTEREAQEYWHGKVLEVRERYPISI